MKAVFLLLLLVLFHPSVFGEADRGCLDNYDIDFQSYPRSLLVDFDVINNGDPSYEYSHIGGYFTYGITYTNVGSENITDLIRIDVNSPSGSYINGFNEKNLDLEVGDKNYLQPIHKNENEVKVFEFINLGTHKIILKLEGVDFFRCLEGGNYVHYKDEIVFAFDPMPGWQKDVVVVEKEILSTLKNIQNNYLQPIIAVAGIIIAIIGMLFSNRVLAKESIRIFYLLISIFAIFIFNPLLILIGIALLFILSPLSYILSLILFSLVAFLYYTYLPVLWKIRFYYKTRNFFKDQFRENKYCFNCQKDFYTRSPESTFRCPFCNSEKVKDMHELEQDWISFWGMLKKKIRSLQSLLKNKK